MKLDGSLLFNSCYGHFSSFHIGATNELDGTGKIGEFYCLAAYFHSKSSSSETSGSGRVEVHCKSLKLNEKCFLDLRNIFLNQENVRKFFSKQDLSS